MLNNRPLATDARFIANADRVAHREALDALITASFATYSAEQVLARLDAAQIANARMNTVEEFLEHPQLAARDRWRTVGSPAGPIRALVPPFGLDDVEPRMGPIPAVGEHTIRSSMTWVRRASVRAAQRCRDLRTNQVNPRPEVTSLLNSPFESFVSSC